MVGKGCGRCQIEKLYNYSIWCCNFGENHCAATVLAKSAWAIFFHGMLFESLISLLKSDLALRMAVVRSMPLRKKGWWGRSG